MKQIEKRSLYDAPSAAGTEEIFDLLQQGESFRLERIVSFGHPTVAGFWYDQPGDEWVLLSRGDAVLEFDDSSRLTLQAGDYLLLPAQCRHRVASVSADAVWLALHFVQRL